MKDDPSSPTLWLPPSYRQGPRRKYSNPLDFWVILLGFKEVFGREASWSDLQDRLTRYSLPQVLHALSQISAVLNRFPAEKEDPIEEQRRICQHVFGKRAPEVLRAVDRFAQRRPKKGVVLFYELQLINAAKAAFLCLQAGEHEDFFKDGENIGRFDLSILGEALLITSDLISAEETPPIKEPQAGFSDEWILYMLANRLFHAGGRWVHDLDRSYDLFLRDRRNLQDLASYLDLPNLAEKITEIHPHALWCALLGLVTLWKEVDLEKHVVAGTVDVQRCFSQYEASADLVLQFASRSEPEMKSAVERRYSPSRLLPFDVLPFAQTPLISFDRFACCPSSKMMADKLTTGLYHLFLQPSVPKGTREQFLNYIGYVFEDYVEQLLVRLFPPTSGRYLREQEMRPRLAGKVCDGLLLYESAAILFEVKGTVMPLEVRNGSNWETLESKLQDIFLDAAKQLEDTIQGIREGKLREIGVDPKGIYSYLPVVVTLDNIGMIEPVYQRIQAYLSANGLLDNDDVLSFQCIEVGELDQIEADIEHGRNLLQLLRGKASSPQWCGESLRNYCFAEATNWMRSESPYLAKVGDKLTAGCEQFFEPA